MTRVDKFNDEYNEEEKTISQEEVVLSRVNKNQKMYDELYMNNSIVDINNVLSYEENEGKEEVKEEEPTQKEVYEEKSYSVNDYLNKAHEKVSPDNAKRDINNQEFKEQEDEIRKLIDSINEKDENEDFFKDLKGDNEDTMIGAKFKTDEFNDSIYENLKMEKLLDGNTILDHALSDNTVLNLEKEENNKLDHTFEEILKSDNRIRNKSKKLPIVIFSITLFILIVVIVIILIFR